MLIREAVEVQRKPRTERAEVGEDQQGSTAPHHRRVPIPLTRRANHPSAVTRPARSISSAIAREQDEEHELRDLLARSCPPFCLVNRRPRVEEQEICPDRPSNEQAFTAASRFGSFKVPTEEALPRAAADSPSDSNVAMAFGDMPCVVINPNLRSRHLSNADSGCAETRGPPDAALFPQELCCLWHRRPCRIIPVLKGCAEALGGQLKSRH